MPRMNLSFPYYNRESFKDEKYKRMQKSPAEPSALTQGILWEILLYLSLM